MVLTGINPSPLHDVTRFFCLLKKGDNGELFIDASVFFLGLLNIYSERCSSPLLSKPVKSSLEPRFDPRKDREGMVEPKLGSVPPQRHHTL